MTSLKGPTRVVSTAGTSPTPQCLGLYQGSVANITDPLQQGRVQLYVPQVLGTAVSNWAKPLGDSPLTGAVILGQYVFVLFIGGDRNQPTYIPQNWATGTNFSLAGNLSVSGTTTLTGLLTANHGATISGGATTITGGATIDILNKALTVYKPADTNRSGGVSSDPDLTVTAAANAVYTFEVVLFTSGTSTAGITYMFSKPSGSAGTYTVTQYNLSGGLQNITSNLSTNNTASVTNPNSNGIFFKGVLDNTGNASGAFTFQWGNQGSGTTTVGQYSYMKLERIA